jgi:hypothetical protein
MKMRKQLIALALLACAPALWADGNPRAEAKAALGGKAVTIEYGRPALKGRDMLGQAQVGQPWRMGADSPTTLKTEADLAFGGVIVPKGDYVLRARKDGDDKWTLLFNQTGKTIAEVPLLYNGKAGESVELLTIDLKEQKGVGRFEMRWGSAALTTDFKTR